MKHNFLIGNKKALVFSCVKCGCFFDEFNYANEQLKNSINKYNLFADSNCIEPLKKEYKINHVSNDEINKLFEENYNLILLKRNGDSVSSILIETKGSRDLKNISDNF